MEGAQTDGYIVPAACVTGKRICPKGGVLLAHVIDSERIGAHGGVETCISTSVGVQRIETDSNVLDAGSIGQQCKRSISRVGIPGRIAQKRSGPCSRVL